MKLRNTDLLLQIHTGMKVYDRDEKEVGTIEYVQFTDENLDEPGPETATSTVEKTEPYRNSLVESIAKAIGGTDNVPEEIREKLLREGFIKIDTGILSPDAYALPKQVSNVAGDKVYLDASHDQLISI